MNQSSGLGSVKAKLACSYLFLYAQYHHRQGWLRYYYLTQFFFCLKIYGGPKLILAVRLRELWVWVLPQAPLRGFLPVVFNSSDSETIH